MHFTTSALVSLLSATALALPNSIRQREVGTSRWTISEYTNSYSSEGYAYSFDMSGPDTPGFGGAFSTSCSANPATEQYILCTDPEFSARLVTNPTDVRTLLVQRKYDSGEVGTVYDIPGGNYTYAAQSVPPSFIVDAQVYGQVIVN